MPFLTMIRVFNFISAQRVMAALLAFTLTSCGTPRDHMPTQPGDSEVSVGMTFDQVEQTWGETDCIFQDVYNGKEVDAWGYGLDSVSGEIVGLPDCREVRIVLYFSNERVITWTEAE